MAIYNFYKIMKSYSKQQLNSLVEGALDALKKDRDREVLRRRSGINVAAQTLEQIGQDLNITRERVRQIEKAAFQKLRDNANHSNDFNSAVLLTISKKGGLISVETLGGELGVESTLEPHLVFLVKINPQFVLIERNDNLNRLVGNGKVFDDTKVKNTHEALIEVIKAHGKPAKFKNIHHLVDGPYSQDSLIELAKASAHLSELDGNWGLNSWPEVNPKSIRDKIYLILKKTGRPMHFTDISEKISKLAANPKKVTTQAVHNELIKDKRFVLIGRGIYALAEWGYRSGTVADIIEEILREENGPLNKDEIVKRVLARRQVKTTTIVLNLQEKPQFKRVKKGVYSLAKV